MGEQRRRERKSTESQLKKKKKAKECRMKARTDFSSAC